MPQVKVLGSLFESHRLNISTNLEIVVAHADCALPQNHVNGLSDCAVALIFELRVN